MAVAGFEPGSSGMGSERTANCATITAQVTWFVQQVRKDSNYCIYSANYTDLNEAFAQNFNEKLMLSSSVWLQLLQS